MKISLKISGTIYIAAFVLICCLIFILVIFIEPIVGVADQGDFFRVFFGIEWPYPDFWSSDHFFKYVTPNYTFTNFPYEKMYKFPFEVSQIYFLYVGRAASVLIGLDHFSQYAYACFCAILYILGITLIYAALLPKNTALRIMFGVGLIFVFMDGNWIQWLNSLYGEPIIMIGLLLTAGLFLFVQKYEISKVPVHIIIFLFIAEIIMMGGKLQAIGFISTAIILSGFLVILIWQQKSAKWFKIPLIFILTAIQVYYCIGLYTGSDDLDSNKDRVFQSVFTGLLLNSNDPEATLLELGLDPAFINDIGKTAYLPVEEYTFGPMHGDLMQEKFFDKINNGVIIKYYLTHPINLFKGLVHSGKMSLKTAGNGVHPRGYDIAIEHNRFTLWTDNLRQRLPANLPFLSLILLLAIVISIVLFKRRYRVCSVLIWALLAGGFLQFLMPYILNGTCDTAKQLLMFNFVFDMCFFIVAAFILLEIGHLFVYDSVVYNEQFFQDPSEDSGP